MHLPSLWLKQRDRNQYRHLCTRDQLGFHPIQRWYPISREMCSIARSKEPFRRFKQPGIMVTSGDTRSGNKSVLYLHIRGVHN